MKVMTILGTRPEIIRLSRVIPRLDESVEHVLVHTGQNYTDSLNTIFFRDLGLRKPDHYLGITAETFGEQVAKILTDTERVMLAEKPDCLLVLGDTNSGLSTVVAARLGIRVFHMEAGNRCYDNRVPEELNRRIIDQASDILMPYTGGSRENLLAEGFPGRRVYVTGNPIYEVIKHYRAQVEASKILSELTLEHGKYFLVTAHRAENVDDKQRLGDLLKGLEALYKKYGRTLVVSLHPRTASRMKQHGLDIENKDIRFCEPFGFFDFIALEQNAGLIISDSGTVQEEACIFKTPNITIRDVTERPETIACGSNILCGVKPEAMLRAAAVALVEKPQWTPPPEYLAENVAETVVRIVLGHVNE
jgi:UDP-N-acetylglucosamine 2-epimerase (non-hydrolysing)